MIYTPPSFFLLSGNTPIAVWGTHLDLIQNPQIRAKHGGKEHINVSARLMGFMEATHTNVWVFPSTEAIPCPYTDNPQPVTPLNTRIVGWGRRRKGIFTSWGTGMEEQLLLGFPGFYTFTLSFFQP